MDALYESYRYEALRIRELLDSGDSEKVKEGEERRELFMAELQVHIDSMPLKWLISIAILGLLLFVAFCLIPLSIEVWSW